jgi:hypothetical protein
MEQHWLIKNNNKKLAVFTLGWSCDFHTLNHIKPEGYDILCLYDYRELTPLETDFFDSYEFKVLVGWSFGVWIATQIFSDEMFDLRIAINGTPYPIDNLKGIPQRVALLTLRALKSSGIEQFNKNAYGSLWQSNPEILPSRHIDSQIKELEKLYEMIANRPLKNFNWDRVVIGSKDRIFPVANQLNCWGEKAIITQSQHYPYFDSLTLNTIFGL